MLKKIKTYYFLRIMFSYVNEGNKLKIIKYNKDLQKITNINLINYIFFSKRYIIYNPEIKGEGKEYNFNHDLIFEGKYLNGERNGRGKEYNHYGKIIFEGEFLKGKALNREKFNLEDLYIQKIDGLYKEYDKSSNKLLFEGE